MSSRQRKSRVGCVSRDNPKHRHVVRPRAVWGSVNPTRVRLRCQSRLGVSHASLAVHRRQRKSHRFALVESVVCVRLCGAGVARRKMRHSSSFVDSNPAQSFGLSIRSAMPPKSQSPRSSSTSARPSRLHKQNSWLCLTNRTTICVYSSPRPRWSFSHALRCSQVVVAWRYEFLHKFVCR